MLEAKYYPAFSANGVPNEMACDCCAKAGFGIPSIVSKHQYHEGDEFCIDCAIARGIEPDNAEQFKLDFPLVL